jgi:purine-nucleoside phosphorylase
MSATPHDAAAAIRERAPGAEPRLALVLGSGLDELADDLDDRVELPYDGLPGFRAGSVAGHAGTLVLGAHKGVPVAVMRGRYHVYEGADQAAVATPIRALKLLGVKALMLTNAAGSLRPEAGPGSVVAISDHINMLGFNPLTGPNDDAFGPRFPNLADAYDPAIRARLHEHADALGTTLHDGVYLAAAGPTFETPAEIRAFRTLGADLVGMSTVPETIVARHCGLRVAAVSIVTNLAEGLGHEQLSHEHTLEQAKTGAAALRPIIERLIERWP